MAAIISTRILRLQAVSPRQSNVDIQSGIVGLSPLSAYTAGTAPLNWGGGGTFSNFVQSIAVTTTGKPVNLAGSIAIDSDASTRKLRLYFSKVLTDDYSADTVLAEVVADIPAAGGSMAVVGADQPAAGSYTYYLKVCPINLGATGSRRSMTLSESRAIPA